MEPEPTIIKYPCLVRMTVNYGKEAIYPANSIAFVFTKLTGKKTLSREDLRLIESLGFEIEAEAPVL